MKEKSFKFTISDKIIRTMNRKQYYKAMSWLRYCARAIRQKIDYEAVFKAITE